MSHAVPKFVENKKKVCVHDWSSESMLKSQCPYLGVCMLSLDSAKAWPSPEYCSILEDRFVLVQIMYIIFNRC